VIKAWFSSPPTPARQTLPTVELAPSYRIPIALILLGIALAPLQWIAGSIVGILGTFLLYQAATLRFSFTATAMEIHQGETQIRSFPYQEWSNWRIFWSPVPILCYFRETKSIHFFPVLFDPKTLQSCLEERCPRV
jgi:hypothetical protein